MSGSVSFIGCYHDSSDAGICINLRNGEQTQLIWEAVGIFDAKRHEVLENPFLSCWTRQWGTKGVKAGAAAE